MKRVEQRKKGKGEESRREEGKVRRKVYSRQ